jgi:hypothetical protein
MKWMVALAAACMVSGGLAIADDHAGHNHGPATSTAPATTATAPAKAKTVNNLCPVSDEAPMDEPVIVSVDGKDYMLCCKMCKKEWDKDSAQYLKKMSEHPDKYGIKK